MVVAAAKAASVVALAVVAIDAILVTAAVLMV